MRACGAQNIQPNGQRKTHRRNSVGFLLPYPIERAYIYCGWWCWTIILLWDGRILHALGAGDSVQSGGLGLSRLATPQCCNPQKQDVPVRFLLYLSKLVKTQPATLLREIDKWILLKSLHQARRRSQNHGARHAMTTTRFMQTSRMMTKLHHTTRTEHGKAAASITVERTIAGFQGRC
jgi:hypothetical protein